MGVEGLSDRELEVLALIARGETNRGIAARLFISEATVKTHLLDIYATLEVNDRAPAVATAYERACWGRAAAIPADRAGRGDAIDIRMKIGRSSST